MTDALEVAQYLVAHGANIEVKDMEVGTHPAIMADKTS